MIARRTALAALAVALLAAAIGARAAADPTTAAGAAIAPEAAPAAAAAADAQQQHHEQQQQQHAQEQPGAAHPEEHVTPDAALFNWLQANGAALNYVSLTDAQGMRRAVAMRDIPAGGLVRVYDQAARGEREGGPGCVRVQGGMPGRPHRRRLRRLSRPAASILPNHRDGNNISTSNSTYNNNQIASIPWKLAIRFPADYKTFPVRGDETDEMR